MDSESAQDSGATPWRSRFAHYWQRCYNIDQQLKRIGGGAYKTLKLKDEAGENPALSRNCDLTVACQEARSPATDCPYSRLGVTFARKVSGITHMASRRCLLS